jgi:hypothetical protein
MESLRPLLTQLGAAVILSAAIGGANLDAQTLPSIFVRLTDGAGAPVSDLRPEEIVVLEDGVERITVTVEPIDWPITLTVLVDNSRSVTRALGQIREGLRGLFNALPGGLEVELLTTAPQPRFLVRRTTDQVALLDGIDLISPDSGAAAFVDALVEASDRIVDNDAPHFPVVLMVATNGPDPSLSGGIDRKFQRLQRQTIDKPATYHVIVWSAPGSTLGQVDGAVQTLVGSQMTTITSGRYEAIVATSRFTTLLPEIGAQIAMSHARQSTQYRVSYLRPAGASPPEQGISAQVTRVGVSALLSFDGRIP